MKKLLASASLVLALSSANAQQDYQFTHYMFDRLSFNPAYAGIEGKFCATAMFREQWAGFGGQPRSLLFNFHAPVPVLWGGAGLTVFSDKLGFQSNTVARASYSFHTPIGSVGTLGIGLQAGIISVGYDPAWVAIDPVPDDPIIPQSSISQVTYDLGMGVYFKGRGYYVGISSTHLTQSELTDVNFTNRRHYQVMGGYTWVMPFANGDFALDPSVLLKSDATSTIVDVNVRCTWRSMVWLGVGYRIKDAIMPMLGGQYTFPVNATTGKSPGTIRLGYAYDVTTSAIKEYSSGSHDIFVNYCFDITKPRPREKFKTVRFL